MSRCFDRSRIIFGSRSDDINAGNQMIEQTPATSGFPLVHMQTDDPTKYTRWPSRTVDFEVSAERGWMDTISFQGINLSHTGRITVGVPVEQATGPNGTFGEKDYLYFTGYMSRYYEYPGDTYGTPFRDRLGLYEDGLIRNASMTFYFPHPFKCRDFDRMSPQLTRRIKVNLNNEETVHTQVGLPTFTEVGRVITGRSFQTTSPCSNHSYGMNVGLKTYANPVQLRSNLFAPPVNPFAREEGGIPFDALNDYDEAVIVEGIKRNPGRGALFDRYPIKGEHYSTSALYGYVNSEQAPYHPDKKGASARLSFQAIYPE